MCVKHQMCCQILLPVSSGFTQFLIFLFLGGFQTGPWSHSDTLAAFKVFTQNSTVSVKGNTRPEPWSFLTNYMSAPQVLMKHHRNPWEKTKRYISKQSIFSLSFAYPHQSWGGQEPIPAVYHFHKSTTAISLWLTVQSVAWAAWLRLHLETLRRATPETQAESL